MGALHGRVLDIPEQNHLECRKSLQESPMTVAQVSGHESDKNVEKCDIRFMEAPKSAAMLSERRKFNSRYGGAARTRGNDCSHDLLIKAVAGGSRQNDLRVITF